MRYTVNFTKKLSFIRQNGDPSLKTKDKDGQIVSETKYNRPGLPRGARYYVPHRNLKTSKYVIDLEQDQLNKLVKEIGFYDEKGNPIVEAPLNNPNAPFWRHPELKLLLSNSGTPFDDEKPIDAFWLACMRADRQFMVVGEEISPTLKSNVFYTITPIGQKITEENQSTDILIEAMSRFEKMKDDVVKMTAVLRAMGVDVRNPDEATLRRSIVAKITTFKDSYSKFSNGETNIETFMRLADENSSSLNIEATVKQAIASKAIAKKGNNKYYYGDLLLGGSVKQVGEFLVKNQDIFNEVLEMLKD